MATMPKTTCPVTRREFQDHAKPVEVKIGEQTIHVLPKEFATGSIGFFAQQKIPVIINGKTAICALQIQMPLVGSKELPKE